MNMNITMDTLVSKLRQTVSHVAYQVNSSVNTIIPGNLIHREYELIKVRCTHGCPKFTWTVHDAVKRDSASIKASLKDAIGPNLLPGSQSVNPCQTTNEGEKQVQSMEKQLYSVFLFDKSQLDSISNRAERELALEHIKSGVTKLTRLRHPSILTVHHPLEESRSTLAFVTEHVYGNLEFILKEQRGKTVLKQERTIPNDLVDLTTDLGPRDSDYLNDSCQLDEVQIKAGLLQICDGLQFLHNDAKTLHRNLCLDNIYVDSNNTWKIAGLDFSCQPSVDDSNGASPTQDLNENLSIVEFTPTVSSGHQFPSLKTLSPSLLNNIVPNWSCSAPEHSKSDKVHSSSDIYSLGVISCALLGNDRYMVDLSYEYGLISDTYKRGISSRELADSLPINCKSIILKYISLTASSRPSLEDYKNLSIFNDEQTQAIRDLDSQFAWDRLKKIDFFNRLRDIIPKLSHQVRVNRVAKSLFTEALNSDMLPYVLPNILIIAKDSTPTEFKTRIFPHLKGPFRILEPKAVPLLLLDNLAILADRAKLCMDEFQSAAFTLVQYLLRMDQQLQEKSLSILPVVKKYIDDKSLVTMILPEINRLCHETNTLSIRVKCLDCVCKIVDSMNKFTIVNQVLPLVYALPSRETEVIMAAVSIVKTIMNDSQADLTRDIIAGKILPFLFPLAVEKDLDLKQFDIIWTLIKNLMDRVAREQREILSRKNQVSTQRSSPLILNDFRGSNHFQID